MIIAKRVLTLQPSATLSAANKARELQRNGFKVINLTVGETDFDTPDYIKNEAIDAINKGFTKYTAVDGIIELKEAIVQKFKRENNLVYNTNQVIVSNGAKQVLFNALLATIDPEDEVIIPTPYWVSYLDMVMLVEGKPVLIETKEQDGFVLNPRDLEKVITNKTKWLILNSPNNPTGAAYSAEQLHSIADVLLRHPNVYIMCDDIYENLIFNDIKFSTLAQVEPRLYNRVLTISGVSKSYAMTGWRIGYAAGPLEIIKKMVDIQSHSTSNPCSISQKAAYAALTGSQDFVKKLREVFEERMNMVYDKINAIKGLSCYKPKGAFYMFVNCQKFFGSKNVDGKIIENSTDFCDYILEQGLVAMVSGAAFGAEGFFRMSYAASADVIEEACNRIKEACNKLITN